jgi:hypothetical protein
MRRSVFLSMTALATATALAGCSGGGGGGGGGGGSANMPGNQTSTLSVSLIDAPVDNVTAVYVEITAMWIKPMEGPAIELPLAAGPVTVNLLGLTDTNAALLIDNATIEPGSYEWLAMDIASERGVRDSYVITNTGGEEELETEVRVPSGRLRLVGGFDVPPNQAVQLLFDWDMRKGLVYPPGQGQYLLKPAFRMLDVTAYGALQGTIAADTVGTDLDPMVNPCAVDDNVDLNVGNVVYVFAGADVAPDDIDGIDPDPIATADAQWNGTDGYTYRLLLDPGDYTVTATCQAANDDPEMDETDTPDEIVFLTPTNVTIAGDSVTVDF